MFLVKYILKQKIYILDLVICYSKQNMPDSLPSGFFLRFTSFLVIFAQVTIFTFIEEIRYYNTTFLFFFSIPQSQVYKM